MRYYFVLYNICPLRMFSILCPYGLFLPGKKAVSVLKFLTKPWAFSIKTYTKSFAKLPVTLFFTCLTTVGKQSRKIRLFLVTKTVFSVNWTKLKTRANMLLYRVASKPSVNWRQCFTQMGVNTCSLYCIQRSTGCVCCCCDRKMTKMWNQEQILSLTKGFRLV